ncbi:Cytochrome c-553-like [Planktothrix serta PCC 8927]|uniref:Cytochrome c-553-like n=1 Tax=Planktothrix serta PCC 8927 TaxID=671068 RepID=A0A7Z9BLB0_9CYAN|nr:cytochrome c [Planktothrix serta]VXD15162.1 Cytochrome c-553-like [Planktothrix serta PCC 8927]
MDNQLAITEIEVLIKRTAFVTLALMVFLLGWIVVLPKLQVSDPYVESVLSLQGDSGRGQEIFIYNCAGCHAWHTRSQVGPSLRDVSLRKSEVGIIQQVISGNTPPMPKFQPSTKEMADLLSYLETL